MMMNNIATTRIIVMNWIVLILFRILALRTEQVLPLMHHHYHQPNLLHRPSIWSNSNQSSSASLLLAHLQNNLSPSMEYTGTLLDRRQLNVMNMNNDPEDTSRPGLEHEAEEAEEAEEEEMVVVERDEATEEAEVALSIVSTATLLTTITTPTTSKTVDDDYPANQQNPRSSHHHNHTPSSRAFQFPSSELHSINKSDLINLTKFATEHCSNCSVNKTTITTNANATTTTTSVRHKQTSIINQLLPMRVKKPLIGAHQHQIYTDVDAISGRMTRLPCFVRPLGPSDSVSLVLWYRGEDISGAPIYSVDARYTPFSNAQHFVHKDLQSRKIVNFTLNDNAFFESVSDQVGVSNISFLHKPASNADSDNYSSSPSSALDVSKPTAKPTSASTAHLYLMPVKESDAGLYWCRVDYKWERTTISIVTVNVIVPPLQLRIHLKPEMNYCQTKSVCNLANNQTITLNEDSLATLVCLSEGGKPLPILNWYRNDELIRTEIFHSLTENNRTLQSELHLTNINSNDHNIILKCLSSNDNQTFLSSQVRLLVNSKPNLVEVKRIATEENSSTNIDNNSQKPPDKDVVMAGTQITLSCRSYGSRPAANHTWFVTGPNRRHIHVEEHRVYIESNDINSELNQMDYHYQMQYFPLVTESTVRIAVQAEDDGHQVVCRAENHLLPKSALEFSHKLNIAFAPKVALQSLNSLSGVPYSRKSVLSFGTHHHHHHHHSSSSSAASLAVYVVRGQQLNLHCNISANPAADNILWYRNSIRLFSVQIDSSDTRATNYRSLDQSAAGDNSSISNRSNDGTNRDDDNIYGNSAHQLEESLITNTAQLSENGTRLIVTNVSNDWQGVYQCVAHNQHGTGYSNQLQVQVLYRPQCVTPTQTIPANIGSVVTMICEVDANPANVTFFWRTKDNDLRELAHSYRSNLTPAMKSQQHYQNGNYLTIKDKDLKSRLEIRIQSGDDFGQYSCWANNFAGIQEEPCFYNVYENPIKQQLICETNISFHLIRVECQRNSNRSSSSNMDPNSRPITSSSSLSSSVPFVTNVTSHQQSVVVFNLKIYKNKKQLINLTSSEPTFSVDTGELRRREQSYLKTSNNIDSDSGSNGDDRASSSESMRNDTAGSSSSSSTNHNYMMLISAMVNGRLTSDISLSFKIPSEPDLSLNVANDSGKDDLDDDVQSGSHQLPGQSQNVSILRYKKTYTNDSPDGDESKKTNAASFMTAATIKQLPLIWTIFALVVMLLIVLILIVLTRLYVIKRRNRTSKPHVRFVLNQDDSQIAESKLTDLDNNGLSCKDYLIEDSGSGDTELENGNMHTNSNAAKAESIQLFTLANFDQLSSTYQDRPSYLCHNGSIDIDNNNGSVSGTDSSNNALHVNLRQALPDLMKDTFRFDSAAAVVAAAQAAHNNNMESQMETSQHNLYIIRQQPPTSKATFNIDNNNDLTSILSNNHLATFCQSGSPAATASTATTTDNNRFCTLPNLKQRQSIRLSFGLPGVSNTIHSNNNDGSSNQGFVSAAAVASTINNNNQDFTIRRTPSVDGIDLTTVWVTPHTDSRISFSSGSTFTTVTTLQNPIDSATISLSDNADQKHLDLFDQFQ